MTDSRNVMPFDKNAEQYVLGAMLNSTDAVNHCIPQLSIDDFYFAENQSVFRAVTDLYYRGNSVNTTNIAAELKAANVTAWHYVLELDMLGTSIDYEYFLSIVLNTSKLRKIIMASQQAAYESTKPDATAEGVIAKLQKELFATQGIGLLETTTPAAVVDNYHDGKSFEEHTLWAFEQIRQGKMPYIGIPSGYTKLDRILGYFKPGCFYVIGARTSMGKTTFLLNLIRNMNSLKRRTAVGFFSLEMPAHIITAKLICLFSGVKYSDLDDAKCTDIELQSVLSWAKTIKELPIYLEDQPGITISQLRARAKRMLQNHKIEVLFIDYLTLIRADNKYSNNHLAVNEVSKGLQNLAKELQIPIIVLAQLNRQVVGRTSNIPTLADLRESGSIEEDIDGCLMLHRPEYYDAADSPGISQILIQKNRLRGQIEKVEFHCPYGEVYCELPPIKHY